MTAMAGILILTTLKLSVQAGLKVEAFRDMVQSLGRSASTSAQGLSRSNRR